MSNREEIEKMSYSIIDKLIQKQGDREKEQEIILEKEKDWALAVNRLFSTPDGEFFAKYFLRICYAFNVDNSKDQVTMLENRGARNIYFRYIRPYLDPVIRSKIENQEKPKEVK